MNITVDIAGIAALIMAAIALWKAWKIQPHESAKADADAALSYANAAESAAKRAEGAELKIAERDGQIKELQSRVNTLESLLAKRERYIIELLSGIAKLTHQLQARDLTPVWTPPPLNPDEQ